MFHSATRAPRRLPLAVLIGAMFELAVVSTAIADTLQVTDCTDGAGSGTLRHVIQAAPTESTIEIPLMCSKISLVSGSLTMFTGQNLTITGQGRALTTIDGGSSNVTPLQQRIFDSPANLTLKGMTLTHASPAIDSNPRGGCVRAIYDLFLEDVLVTDCAIVQASGTNEPLGAGIYTAHNLTLSTSTITGNIAIPSPGHGSAGGGAFAFGGALVIDSTISDNTALSNGGTSRGGGLYSYGNSSVFLIGSTISGNYSDIGSGLYVFSGRYSGSLVDILNSTIANNTEFQFSAVYTHVQTYVTNSTIAFNRNTTVSSGDPVAGLSSQLPLTINNSIFANNSAKSPSAMDVYSNAASNPLVGSNNLITGTRNGIPFDTITACPKLGHLSDNGGPTQTIPLLSNSPALNVGSPNGQTNDQRGTGFPRTVGSGTDIGAYERQAGVIDDVIFFSKFDSRCN